MSPSKIEKVEHETVQHAESRQQKLTWEYGELGDSMKEDVYVRVKYCTTKRCRTIDFNGTSGVIEELNRKTKYNYTVQVRDRTFMKFSKISVGKEFTTEEKGEQKRQKTINDYIKYLEQNPVSKILLYCYRLSRVLLGLLKGFWSIAKL